MPPRTGLLISGHVGHLSLEFLLLQPKGPHDILVLFHFLLQEKLPLISAAFSFVLPHEGPRVSLVGLTRLLRRVLTTVEELSPKIMNWYFFHLQNFRSQAVLHRPPHLRGLVGLLDLGPF